MKTLVLGGSGGIGEKLVENLCQQKHQVSFTYCHDKEKAEKIEKKTGAKKLVYDYRSTSSEQDLMAVMEREKFEGLVHCAAEPYERKLLLKTDGDALLNYITPQFRSAFVLSQCFAAAIKNANLSGAIVNVLSSVVLGMPPEKQSAYVILKYMLLGLSRCQSAEFRNYKIRVNCVSPGMTRTEFIADLPPRFIETLEQTLPAGRIASAEEVAAVIVFLLSPQASYIQGANIPITGGSAC